MVSLTARFKWPAATRTLVKAGAITAGLGTLGASACYAKPFLLAVPYYRRQPQPIDNISSSIQTAQRRKIYEQALMAYYLPRSGGKIDWYQFADIVEWVARSSPSDQDFRQDICWRGKGQRSPFARYLDPLNRGLPPAFHNSHYRSEQMHHYLGGTIGNTDTIPSHLKNNPLYALLYELRELAVTGKYNWGDVRLFNISQKHRDDFLKLGRFTVADNIRRLLLPRPRQSRFSISA
jgi:hypothetical protein